MGDGTEIGRVRGLGSGHNGSHHWLMQRFTAIGNLVLTVWLALSLVALPNYSLITVHDWIARPLPALAMALSLVSVLWHARLGMQVMLEDYVHTPGNKFACMALLNLAVVAAVSFGLLCVVRLALGGL